MNTAGYSTFVVDRLGTGKSGRPPGVTLISTAQADAISSVAGDLRACAIGGRKFPRVVTAGHSLGAAIALIEAAHHRDVDGVMITGLSHQLQLTDAANIFLTSYRQPAMLDPKFAGKGYDPTYITSLPGTRGKQF